MFDIVEKNIGFNRTGALTGFAFNLLIFLIIFLPFSSWLVSLTGWVNISALRDVIAILLLALGVIANRGHKKNNIVVWLALIFLIYIVLTFFWREAGALQWLKGARFLAGPILIYLALSLQNFSDRQKLLFRNIILAVSAVILMISLLELCGILLPLTSSMSLGGALEPNHYVGELNIRRLQSILSGPNALGLYLLAVFAFIFASFNNKWWQYIFATAAIFVIITTFSRGVFLGFVASSLLIIYELIARKWSRITAVVSTIILIIFLAGGLFVFSSLPQSEQFITHNASSTLRFEQYQRIWDQKYEIGLLGRGTGTAGPSSQNRLDGGENHWTENIYLDVFEELGLIGLIIFVTLLFLLYRQSIGYNDIWSRASRYAILGFAVTGVFLNIYTGQAGVWMMFIFLGISSQKNEQTLNPKL